MRLTFTVIPIFPCSSCCMVSSYFSHLTCCWKPSALCWPVFAALCLRSLVFPAAVIQFLFSPVLLHRNLLSTILSILLYVVALSYYHYLNFLGYSALPFLDHTEVGSKACDVVHAAHSVWHILPCPKRSVTILTIVVAGVSVAHRRYSHDSCLCVVDKFQPNKIYSGVLFCVNNAFGGTFQVDVSSLYICLNFQMQSSVLQMDLLP